MPGKNSQTSKPCPNPTLSTPLPCQIYPNLATGFTDATPYLRELTLKSMAILGPKLTQKTINQSMLKYLAKLQVWREGSVQRHEIGVSKQ